MGGQPGTGRGTAAASAKSDPRGCAPVTTGEDPTLITDGHEEQLTTSTKTWQDAAHEVSREDTLQ